MASEHTEVINEIIDWLKVTNKAFAWKNNSGVFRKGARVVRFGLPGSPDILGICNDGKFLGIEVKIGKDKQRKEQLDFEDICRKLSGHYLVAKNLDDVVNYFTEKPDLKLG